MSIPSPVASPPTDAAVTVSDILQVGGTIAAAIIGLVGLAIVLLVEARQSARRTFTAALAEVIQALGARAVELDKWSTPPDNVRGVTADTIRTIKARRNEAGGPLDAPMQSAVDAAFMLAPRADRPVMVALADCTYSLKLGPVSWQIKTTGEIAGLLRKWKSGEITPPETIEQLRQRQLASS